MLRVHFSTSKTIFFSGVSLDSGSGGFFVGDDEGLCPHRVEIRPPSSSLKIEKKLFVLNFDDFSFCSRFFTHFIFLSSDFLAGFR